MGPYMRPIPVGSLGGDALLSDGGLCRFAWQRCVLLATSGRSQAAGTGGRELAHAHYRRVMTPLITSARKSLFLLCRRDRSVADLSGRWFQWTCACEDASFRQQERTPSCHQYAGWHTSWNKRLASRRHWDSELGRQPDVLNYQVYAGTSGPYNFKWAWCAIYINMRRQSESGRHSI